MERVALRKEFFGQLLVDLEEQVLPEQAKALKTAVDALPADALVTTSTIDALGLPANVRANFFLLLLKRAYPEQVRAQRGAAANMAELFKALLAGGKAEVEWDKLPVYLDDFAQRVAAADAKTARTGKLSLGDVSKWKVELAEQAAGKVGLSIQHAQGKDDLVLERPDARATDAWTVTWQKQRFPLGHLDIPSLDGLVGKLVPHAARGTADPMLKLLREERDKKGGGALDGLIAAAEKWRDKKQAARDKQLAEVDAALRQVLAPYVRVGRAPDDAVKKIADAAMKAAQEA